MNRLGASCALIATLGLGCATSGLEDIEPFEQSGKADGLASKLKHRDDHQLHVDEPSDLAFTGGKLYTVSDRHSTIYEIDDDGDVKDEVNVEGSDLEAIAVDNDGHFYIADESKSKVWRVNRDGERVSSIEVDDAADGNSGIEGLAFDDDGDLYVAKEKDPARIWKLQPDGDELERESIEFADDLSALAWNSEDGHLYALSDQEHALYRLDSEFEKITAWRLPIEHPEGLAFDGNTVYIASDPEERLYVFELD
ncbi:MAG: SdiA-regulated domain-containing protein [Kofleriaceae bacterium]